MSDFVDAFNELAAEVHQNAVVKGFWDGERNNGEMIALIHSEASEALEALRHDPLRYSEKIPAFLEIEEELADALIRLADMACAREWRVAEAVEAKMAYNATRGHKHGKAF